MPKTTAVVPTANASRYLQQLCKHWSHKFETSFDAAQGTVRLPDAELRMVADAAALHLDLSGPEAAALPRLSEVVADHVRRFALREELVFDWSEAAEA